MDDPCTERRQMMRQIIENAKAGSEAAVKFLRVFVAQIAHGATPDSVIIAVCELVLEMDRDERREVIGRN